MNIPITFPWKNTLAPQSATPPAMAPPILCDVFQKPKYRPRFVLGAHLEIVE